MSNYEEISSGVIFDRGQENPFPCFTGRSYLNMLVADETCPVGNVTFEPGCRTNWHMHKGGQILLVTGGEGFYQAEGEPAQQLHAGDVVNIPAGVKHWHGAATDGWFSHIAIEVQPQNGMPEWLEPVSDEDYAAVNA